MAYEQHNVMNCTRFEELLTDYLDKALEPAIFKAVAEHAMSCPLCHALLNDVKGAMAVCRELAEPKLPLTRLEAKILASTVPNASLHCEEFENYLTDYLDGFLPAQVFHRWERHAVLCDDCTDLPGAVVRSLGLLVAYKSEELPVPAGLHERIMQQTIGTVRQQHVRAAKASVGDRFKNWVGNLSFPISVPQLAPVGMMMMFAFLVFSQTVSADGSLTDVYAKSFELAEQTYRQGADAFNGKVPDLPSSQNQEPINGTKYVEDKR
jgi:predicted anti-sigma-YlaC factor YlaD